MKRTPKKPSSAAPSKRAKTPPRAKRSAPARSAKATPKSLAARARDAHAAKMQRLATRAQDALARIRERQADVTANMVDIGLALLELKGDGMAEALGRASFAEIVALDLKMSLTTANMLVAVATRVPLELTTRIGTERASALLALTDATPDDDTVEDVLNATLTLPSGERLEVATATSAALREAAKEIRAAQPEAQTKRAMGFSASPEDKAAYAAVMGRYKKHTGAPAAKMSLVATRDGKGAKVRIEVRLSELAALADALAAAMRAK